MVWGLEEVGKKVLPLVNYRKLFKFRVVYNFDIF